ncbi:MAG: AI-2E family transporter [Planctomycetes bacterium]|nr:AI-2E family transporter [Planctomycetota bacterium]
MNPRHDADHAPSPIRVHLLAWGALALALILAVVGVLVPVVSVVLLIFAGVLFGIFLNGLSAWLSRHTPLRYSWALFLWVTVIVAFAAAGCYFMGSHVAQRAVSLAGELRSAWQDLMTRMEQYEWLPPPSRLETMFRDAIASQVSQTVQYTLWAVTGVVVIFFVGLYVAYDPELYQSGLVKLVPQSRRERAAEVLQKLRATLGRWIIGRLLSMCIIGVATAIGLALMGVPLPITLGVLAAILTFIPNLGPVLAAVPQALLAFQVSSSMAVYVIIFNIVLQGVESYILTPIIQRYEVTLPPALTITVQLIFGVAIGVIGVMMAAPLTAAAMVVVQMLYIRDRLHDPSPGELATR